MKYNPRAKAPEISRITKVDFPIPDIMELPNGVCAYAELSPKLEVLKIQVVFKAGRPYENCRLASRFTALMMKEGTSPMNSGEISEFFDRYGATVQSSFDFDRVYLSLYCLSKYASILLPKFSEFVYDCSFPTSELSRLQDNSLQKLRYDLSKPDYVSYRQITESIFGESHPYGYNSSEKHIRALHREKLLDHYNLTIKDNIEAIFISGQLDSAGMKLLIECFGTRIKNSAASKNGQLFEAEMIDQGKETALNTKIQLDDMDQISVKLGRRTFGKQHKHHFALSFLNTILGGYFGSRLMSEIREKQGLTYNIYSSLDYYDGDGCLLIGAEVNAENYDKALEEIRIQMRGLESIDIEQEELTLVSNYIKGHMLARADGPFKRMRTIQNIILNQLPHDHHQQYFNFLSWAEAGELRQMASIYLNPDHFYEVIVGDLMSN